MTREMQHESEKSSSESRPDFATSAMDETTARRMELARVSDTFRNLENARSSARIPAAEQWRKFSDGVFQQIENRPGGLGMKLRTMKDKISATDSESMRAVALIAIIAITLLAAALVWLAISFALPHPAPHNVTSELVRFVGSLTA